MFYIVADTGQIVELLDRCPTQEDLIEMTQEFRCGLYVIDGQHAGLEVAYEKTEEEQ